MIQVVNAPDELYSIEKVKSKKVYLSGGIFPSPDWQNEFINILKNKIKSKNLIIYNPRRDSLDYNNKKDVELQIVWEFEHLESSDFIIYWFSRGSINPTNIYNLGRFLGKKDLIIGIDPEYERIIQVEIQSNLLGYSGPFPSSLESLADLFIKETKFEIMRKIGI